MNIREIITNRVIELIEEGVKSDKPLWNDYATGNSPRNYGTNISYKGINSVILYFTKLSMEYKSNAWLTYNQAKKLGGQVRKGEKSTMACYFSPVTKETKQADTGESESNSFMLIKPFLLFNVDQIDGLPEIEEMATPEFEPIERAESLINATGAIISYQGNKAFYRPSSDEIYMPVKENFTSKENFYATILHELSHWSGNESRLKRDFSGRFGDSAYALEELVAEMSASFLMGELGLFDATIQNHASYVQSWLKALKDHKSSLFIACSQAQKAADFILNFRNGNQVAI